MKNANTKKTPSKPRVREMRAEYDFSGGVLACGTYVRRGLLDALCFAGYEVLEAGTGQEAIVEAAQRKPDVVVLDLNLPFKNGHEVIVEMASDLACAYLLLRAAQADPRRGRRCAPVRAALK